MAPGATTEITPTPEVEQTTPVPGAVPSQDTTMESVPEASPVVDGPVVDGPVVDAPADAPTAAEVDPARPFAGKVAVITGAGRGIGKGIALELARRGCDVVVNYGSSAKGAEEVCEELRALGTSPIALQADISKPAEVAGLFDRAMAHYGHVEFVISNSGMEVWCPEVEVTEDLFDQVFNLNCRGQFFVAQQGLKYCSRGGRIILTSSVAATMTGVHNHALYAGSKAAVEGFTRSFAVDCGPKQVTVNAIAPGGVKTDMYTENSWHYAPGGYKGMPIETIDAGLSKICPLGRVGVPADVGRAVSALCSTDCEWINGQVIKVTGGGT